MTNPYAGYFLPLAGLAALALSACGGDDDDSGGAVAVQDVYINELMPSNQTVYEDPDGLGEYDDWIELYNGSSTDAALSGHFISDDRDDRFRHELPEEATVPAGGVLVLMADGEPWQGPLHLSFRLSRDGEGLWLSDPAGNHVDSIVYDASPGQYSYARFPDGTGDFAWCEVPSPEQLNGPACGATSSGAGGAAGSPGQPAAGAGGAPGAAGGA